MPADVTLMMRVAHARAFYASPTHHAVPLRSSTALFCRLTRPPIFDMIDYRDHLQRRRVDARRDAIFRHGAIPSRRCHHFSLKAGEIFRLSI